MFVKNSFEYDARVEKEASSLAAAGHEVTVVALLIPGVTPEVEEHSGGFTVRRVPQMQFGLGRVLRWASRTGGVDVGKPSTATPGSDRPAEARRPEGRGVRSVLARGLAGTARIARWLLAIPARAIKDRSVDRRMEAMGLDTGAAVFHAHDLNTLRVAARCARARRSKLVYDSHELATERSRMGRWARWRAARLERRLLPSVNAVIVASPAWGPLLRDRYSAVLDRVITIVNTPVLRDPEPVDLCELTGLPAGTPVVLYQGSIQEHRGIEPAIEAVGRLDGVALVVIGYGHHRPTLETMVERRGFEDRVRFTGPIPHDRLLDHTAGAAIGLCNIVSASLSYHTSLPNKLFEYLMAGIPVIGSEGPEIARVVTETGAGVVVPATDAGAIASAIVEILGDRERLAAAARRAREHHHWAVEEEKLVDLYRELAA